MPSPVRSALLQLIFLRLLFGQASEYDAIYSGKDGVPVPQHPNEFLVEMTKGIKPGRALDVGMGQGRNSIYLAKQGWDVTGFDASGEGVRLARAEAARLGLSLSASVAKFEQFDFGESRWDLIVLTYEPTRAIAPKIPRALRPGGIVVIEDRHMDTKRAWPEGGLLGDNELLSLFPGLRAIRYEDLWAVPDWQAMRLKERLVRLCAKKPQSSKPGCVWEGKAIPQGDSVCWDKSVRFRCEMDGWLFTREKCER
jgi:SAM-dependent methyltransferase